MFPLPAPFMQLSPILRKAWSRQMSDHARAFAIDVVSQPTHTGPGGEAYIKLGDLLRAIERNK